MKFTPAPIPGGFVVDLEPIGDERGFFSRMFCQTEFAAAGLESRFVQMNDSYSATKGTLRGLHYQLAPSAEVKLVRCIRGAAWDVILDLREDQPTFGQWFGAEITADNRRAMYVPRGFAHGFITLMDDTELVYMVSSFYDKVNERGVRWNDPRFNVGWPIEPTVISARDQGHPDFDPELHLR